MKIFNDNLYYNNILVAGNKQITYNIKEVDKNQCRVQLIAVSLYEKKQQNDITNWNTLTAEHYNVVN